MSSTLYCSGFCLFFQKYATNDAVPVVLPYGGELGSAAKILDAYSVIYIIKTYLPYE
jgi:hypothetical protein